VADPALTNVLNSFLFGIVKAFFELWWLWLLILALYLVMEFLNSILYKVDKYKKHSLINKLYFKRGGSKKCPQCGGNLVKRTGKYGDFYGCQNYPKCRFTEKIG